jgi:hypothetical protein
MTPDEVAAADPLMLKRTLNFTGDVLTYNETASRLVLIGYAGCRKARTVASLEAGRTMVRY